MSTQCISSDNRYIFFLFFFNVIFVVVCFACASNVGSPTKFIVDDNTKVSVLINLLYVIVFETKIEDKRAKLMFLSGGK